MTLPAIQSDKLLSFLVGLLNTPSPTGFTEQAITFTEQALAELPELELCHTRKGALLARWRPHRACRYAGRHGQRN